MIRAPVQSAVTGAFAVDGVPSSCAVISRRCCHWSFPFTFRPPVEPVLFRMIPLEAGALEEMLRNSRLFAPIVVALTR